MNPLSIIRQATADGVSLAVSDSGNIKAAGTDAAMSRWLPVLREHKAGIVAALQDAANDTSIKSFRWLIHFADRNSMEVTFSPEVDLTGALAGYPDAVAAEALIPCRSCAHAARPGLGNLYCGGRDDLLPAYGQHHPLRQLPNDGGVSCHHWEGEPEVVRVEDQVDSFSY